jgi:hypothetical protein
MSKSEVATGRGRKGVGGSDVVLDQRLEIAVPDLGGDPGDRCAVGRGGGGVAGA